MLAVGAAVGCTEEMVDPSEFGEKTIWAVMNEGTVKTRTCVSDDKGDFFGVLWCKGDAIGVYSASGTQNAKFETQIEEPSAKAAFTGSLSGTPAYAYYPYSEANANSSTIKGNLPSVQDFSSADGLLKYDYKLGVASTENKDQFAFDHLFSLLRFTINADGTGVVGEKLQKVEITFPDGVTLNSGAFTVPVNGKATDVNWDATSTEKTLTLNWTDTPAMTAGQTLTGYLNCPPVSGLKGKSINVKLITSTYAVSFNATVNIDAFAAGYVYTFPLTLSEWKKNAESNNYAEEKMETPSLESFSFTAANNPGKILAKKLYYDPDKEGTNSSGDTYYGFTHHTEEAKSTTQEMEIDNAKNSITGCIPYLYDRNLKPTVTPADLDIQYSSDGNTFVNWDKESSIDFGSVSIIRIVKNGVSRDYSIKISNTGLPIVVLNQPGNDTEWEHIGDYVWNKEADFDDIQAEHPGNITVYNANGTMNLETVTSMTRLRGNTTKDYPKKPFAVKLVEDAEILGMPAHKRWILLANWKDKSLMRNHIGLGIARKFSENMPDGIPWNVRGQFVEVVYNGVHIGNYYLCEQIKIGDGRLAIGQEYKAKNGTVSDFTKYAYLLEVDDNYDEAAKFVSRHYLPFMFKDDVDEGGVILSTVKDKVKRIETNLYDGYNGTASGYTAAYNDLDLPSVIDQLLIYELSMNTEFRHPKSVYMFIDHSDPASQRYGKLCAGPVWDFDYLSFPTLNSGYTEESDRSYSASLMATKTLYQAKHYRYNSSTKYPSSPIRGDAPFMWYPMLIHDPNFRSLVAERWNKIYEILSIYAKEINDTRDLIAVSWEYNNAMWPAYYDDSCDRQCHITNGMCGDEKLKTFTEVTEAFYKAYTTRLEGMDAFISDDAWPIDYWSINTRYY